METKPMTLPMVPLRGMVVFPKVVTQLDIGRTASVQAVKAAMDGDQYLAVATQKDENIETPTLSELGQVGTIVKINQMLRLPGGVVRILVEGVTRIQLDAITSTDPYYVAEVTPLNAVQDEPMEEEAYRRILQSKFAQWVEVVKPTNDEGIDQVMNSEDASELADQIAFILPINTKVRQSILDELSVSRRLNMVVGILNTELQINDIENSINNQVRQQMEKAQKEYFLREKIRIIHDELGDKMDPDQEANELREQLEALGLPEEIHTRIDKEITRYSRMPQMMPESNILRNYIDWLLQLPWTTLSDDRLELKEASDVLDGDHYGLEKIKKRILEFLAVRKLSGKQSGSILCLVGPPGVGKTSLASSIAKAMNRKFIRASLGGVRDEAEIRGHRRTYVGALPGRMIS